MASEFALMMDMLVEIAFEFIVLINIFDIILLLFSRARDVTLYMLTMASEFVLMLAMFVLTAS